MFTGLVQALGKVEALASREGGARLEIDTSLASDLKPGDSVLVNGVCLTAVDCNGTRFAADLSTETLDRSTLGRLSAGEAVNLELPLRLQDRLGGHLVQGHVDAIASVRSVTPDGDGLVLAFEAPPSLMRYIVEKGSVTLDGVSLTITQADEQGFGVSLIPETLARTNLKDAEPGRRVNLEVDMIAKYVESLMRPRSPRSGRSELS